MSLLHKIKKGKKNFKLVDFPGTEEKIAMVVLSSNEMTDSKLEAESYCEENKIVDENYQDIALQQSILYRALRDKDNLDKKLTDNIMEFRESMDVTELAYLMVQYNFFQTENSPFLSAVTEEQFEQLKKTLEKMSLKELNGESLLALRNFLMSLV